MPILLLRLRPKLGGDTWSISASRNGATAFRLSMVHDATGVEWSWVDDSPDEFANVWGFPVGIVNRHFSGNFFWVNSSFVNEISDEAVTHGSRMNAETFIGHGWEKHKAKPRIKNFHSLRHRLYESPYERRFYDPSAIHKPKEGTTWQS